MLSCKSPAVPKTVPRRGQRATNAGTVARRHYSGPDAPKPSRFAASSRLGRLAHQLRAGPVTIGRLDAGSASAGCGRAGGDGQPWAVGRWCESSRPDHFLGVTPDQIPREQSGLPSLPVQIRTRPMPPRFDTHSRSSATVWLGSMRTSCQQSASNPLRVNVRRLASYSGDVPVCSRRLGVTDEEAGCGQWSTWADTPPTDISADRTLANHRDGALGA